VISVKPFGKKNLAHKRSISQAIKLENDGRAMNGLGVRELCCLFCCPPWPSKIAAKLAFLPPEPTYTFVEENGAKQAVCLSDRAEWQYSEREKENMEVFYTRTSRQNRIACMFIRFVPCYLFPLVLIPSDFNLTFKIDVHPMLDTQFCSPMEMQLIWAR
jgi:hypothetical protein